MCWNFKYILAALDIKAPSKNVQHTTFYFSWFSFSKKISFDISCESSALADDSHEMSRLIFSKNKIKMLSDAVVIGALRVQIKQILNRTMY